MTSATETPEPVTRPDGRLYRPRKIMGYPVADADDFVAGIMILGTNDPGRAQQLADHCAALWTDWGSMAADPEPGWFREGYESGQLRWIRDEKRGRAGVLFHQIKEHADA